MTLTLTLTLTLNPSPNPNPNPIPWQEKEQSALMAVASGDNPKVPIDSYSIVLRHPCPNHKGASYSSKPLTLTLYRSTRRGAECYLEPRVPGEHRC